MSLELHDQVTQIRLYEVTDLAACMDCFQSNTPPAFTVAEITLFRNFLERVGREHPETLPYWVLEKDGRVVGCGGLGLNENGTVSLTWGLVHSAFHKQGLGRQLLEYRLQQWALLFPQSPLRLDTTQHAVTFFEKYGFRTVQYTPDGYEPRLHRYDMMFA